MEWNKNIISKLNDLVEKNYDACEGYKNAAQKADSPALRSFLNDYAIQREQFVEDLKNEILKLGGEPEDGGSIGGDLHRAWMDMRLALSSDNDEAVLEECINGEQSALDEYRDVLRKAKFRGSTMLLIKNQLHAVENAYNRIRSLEHSF